MREIKFRAWDKELKKWFSPTLDANGIAVVEERHEGGCGCGAVYYGTHFIEYPRQYELVQYTGIKDKNGKEIYEFDQLKGDWDVVNDICLGTVEFYGGAFRIKETGLPLAWADKDKDCEVVGNKFEGLQNPSKGDIM